MQTPPDSSIIDEALTRKLLNDATLRSLMPDGIYWDEAKANAKRFIIISLVIGNDIATFEKGRSVEDNVYLVKAVELASSGANIRAAARRIDQLLENQSLDFTEGYDMIAMFREERIKSLEVDEVDPSIRWQHRGGRYRVQVAIR